jgi:cobalt/nickel transport system permease protein
MKEIHKYSLLFLVAAIVVVSILLPIASEHPDGLERVAENLGFMNLAEEVYKTAPMPNYSLFGIEGYIGSLISGISGIILVLGLGLGTGYLIKRRNKNAS